jgi:RimJ/RimL family protein N-acetyltransferase
LRLTGQPGEIVSEWIPMVLVLAILPRRCRPSICTIRDRARRNKTCRLSVPLMNDLKLETPRLCLRLMQSSDLDGLLRIFGDPKVMASFGGAIFNREQMERWLQRNIEHQSQYGYDLFSVILKSEGLLVGDCGLEHMVVDGDLATELGYDFRSDYWNQGFATEAATAVRDYAFYVLHLPGLISLIRVGNAASKRVSEKIGMRFVAEITRNGISYWKYAIDGGSNTHG